MKFAPQTETQRRLIAQAGIAPASRKRWNEKLLARQHMMVVDIGPMPHFAMIAIYKMARVDGARDRATIRKVNKVDVKRVMQRLARKFRIPSPNIRMIRTKNYDEQAKHDATPTIAGASDAPEFGPTVF